MVHVTTETFPTRRGATLALFVATFWWIFLSVDSGYAYKEVPNFTGGHLQGTVSIKGTLVPPRRFNLVLYADPYYCGRISDGQGWRFSPITKPGPNRSLPGAIVFLEDVPQGKPVPSAPGIIQTKDCMFLPYVGTAKSGQRFHFQNWDPIEHKLEIFLTSSTGGVKLFGQVLPPHPDNRKSDFLSEGTTGIHQAGSEVIFAVDRTGTLLFRCRYHEYMEGWSVLVPHPYVTTAGKHGEFSLTDIPPGTYNLVIWHPMGQSTNTIHILPDHTLDVDVDVLSTPATIYPEDTLKPDPFGIDLVGDTHIVPSVDLQQWDVPTKDVR